MVEILQSEEPLPHFTDKPLQLKYRTVCVNNYKTLTSKDDSKVDKVPVRETTSLKSKFESVNNDDGEFEQHLTNLIEDLNDTQKDVQGTPIEGSKTKDWSNVCGTCGKKFKYPSRMKTHQRLKGCKGNLKLNFPYWREVV